MSALLAYRLLKFLSLAALAVGLGLSVGQPRQAARASAALWLATPALWTSWLAGFLLLKATQRPMNSPFVGAAVLASLAGLHGAILAATRPSPGPVTRWLAPAGLGVATAVMVTRDAPAPVALAAALAAALGAAALLPALPAPDGEPDPDAAARARRWFLIVARLEGTSLALMLLVAMPLRRATGISLDGGTGALGWAHGSLVLLYLQALQVAARALGWSWGRVAAAFVASLVPLGTFGFEAYERRQPS